MEVRIIPQAADLIILPSKFWTILGEYEQMVTLNKTLSTNSNVNKTELTPSLTVLWSQECDPSESTAVTSQLETTQTTFKRHQHTTFTERNLKEKKEKKERKNFKRNF